jgi:hypothetical protein
VNTQGNNPIQREKEIVDYDFIFQAEQNPDGYFIVEYADGRDCELKGIKYE